MRRAQKPQEVCGSMRSHRRPLETANGGALRKRASQALAALAVLLCPTLGFAQQNAQQADQLIDLIKKQPNEILLAPPQRTFRKDPNNPNLETQFAKPPARPTDRASPLYLEGDQLIYDTRGNRVIARGNVQIYHNSYILTANEVIYDQTTNTLTANGNVTIKEPNGNIVKAESTTLSEDFRDGFVQSLSVTASDDSRIVAERAVRREANVNEFVNAKYSPCKSSGEMPPLWCISGGRIVHDQNQGTVTYEDAQFLLYGLPVFYLPYFQHPDPSVRRRSGFLLAEHSSATHLGYGVEVPYYFALAPNYDFLFHPKYMSKQGVLYQGNWRQRFANGEYSVKFAGIDQREDSSGLVRDDLQNKVRGSVQTTGNFELTDWWRFGWNITLESDDTFRRFYKLDSVFQTDRINNVFMIGQSQRNYFAMNLYQFGGLLLEDTPQAESKVHPVIDYNYVFNDPVLGGEMRWDTNVLSFSRSDALSNLRHTDINRVSTEVSWRRKITDALGITYTPFAQARGDAYQISNVVNPASGALEADDSLVRGIATGAFTVSYPWVARTQAGQHVIEPTAQIVARQASIPQRNLPDEDAKSLVFDTTNLFEVDKFSGRDRIQSGTRANAGLQYTFQLNSGGYASLLAGQSFHLTGENAYRGPGIDADGKLIFDPRSGLQDRKSDYVFGATLAPTNAFRIVSQSRLSETDFSLRREDAYARFSYGPLALQAAYSFTAADPDNFIAKKSQHDVYGLLGLRLTDRWSVLGSLRYDIDAKQRIQDVLQLRYADECFVLTASYTETFVSDPTRDIQPDRAVMFRFELKNLGEFRHATNVTDHLFTENQPVKQ